MNLNIQDSMNGSSCYSVLLSSVGNKWSFACMEDKKLQYQAHVFYVLGYKIVRESGDKAKVGKNPTYGKTSYHT